MDLGIRGKWAVVCGASKGLGYGCARSLAGEGVNVVINARHDAPLQEAARRIRDETGVEVIAVAGDITTAPGRGQVLAAARQVDILVTNAGGPPAGDFRTFSRDDWIAAIDANMLTPIELIKATVDSMIERKFGRIVNITSSAVKAPIDILALSNGARSGLTGFIAGLSRTTVFANVTINNLLPGRFMTDRLRSSFPVQAKNKGITVEEVEQALCRSIPAKRFGNEMEFGQYCAWLCSQQASYVTGQNLLIDGGVYPGTF
ncbi:SDR family oxidoreductase [Ramlibacter rhizophilus]|uniref:SDR family oxidoreductase n=1 Tax=Ramlibacter rhizophilus TaxID=1781167 RepID=A0A4Z0BN02_9BURK|nr:SDR family oxidoreductase [Ramlibacter rhizophilus]TFY99799.1 SDR family oxidoreductase [Ramlibacter rhizophilus]